MARMAERIRKAAQPQPGTWASAALQQGLGVDVDAGDPGREVKRRPAAVPTGAADDLASGHPVPRPDHDRGEE